MKREKPNIPVTFIDVENQPMRGSKAEKALVTIVEVGDYGCPDTLDAEVWMKDILDQHPEARWYFAPAVFESRPAGIPMTRLAEVIPKEHFWKAHDLIWKNFKKTDDDTINKMYAELGVDPDELHNRPIPHGNRLFEQLELTWVPTFFVNGIPYFGESVEPLKTLVSKQVEFSKTIKKETGLQGDALYKEIVSRNTP